MRGQKVYELIKSSGIETETRRGRNNSLVSKRNECLIARYFFHCHCKKKCYEDVLGLLIGEFFISPITIINLVQDHTDELKAMKQKRPSLYFFQSRWPHMKWA